MKSELAASLKLRPSDARLGKSWEQACRGLVLSQEEETGWTKRPTSVGLGREAQFYDLSACKRA